MAGSIESTTKMLAPKFIINGGTGNRVIFVSSDSTTNQFGIDNNLGALRIFREDVGGANGYVAGRLSETGNLAIKGMYTFTLTLANF